MGLKKIARPINEAKNKFVKWLKNNNVECLDEYEGDEVVGFVYYRHVSGFINDVLYDVYFMMFSGEKIKIDYSDEENRYNDMSIDEFLQLIN